jgi:outer membrane lipoprotein LolB
VIASRAGLAAGAFFAVALLAGCSTLKPVTLDASASFDAHGRMSVHYKDLKGGKEDTVFGRFEWIEHGPTVDLALLDPLGQGIATVHAAPGDAVLKLADGREFHGASADLLTQEALGYTVPVEGLRSWLVGRSSVAGKKPEANPDGGLMLKEAGWTIDYPAPEMPPRRIDLHYSGPDIALDLRLAIEEPSLS